MPVVAKIEDVIIEETGGRPGEGNEHDDGPSSQVRITSVNRSQMKMNNLTGVTEL